MKSFFDLAVGLAWIFFGVALMGSALGVLFGCVYVAFRAVLQVFL